MLRRGSCRQLQAGHGRGECTDRRHGWRTCMQRAPDWLVQVLVRFVNGLRAVVGETANVMVLVPELGLVLDELHEAAEP